MSKPADSTMFAASGSTHIVEIPDGVTFPYSGAPMITTSARRPEWTDQSQGVAMC